MQRLATLVYSAGSTAPTACVTQVSGLWLRSESLANLALLAQPHGAPLLQVCRAVHVATSLTTRSL